MATQKFYEGQSATNPATGEKIVYRGGRWYPASGSGASAPVSTGTEQDRKALQELRDGAQKSLMSAQQADKFIELNRNTGTGGLRSLPLLPWGDSTVGDAISAGNPDWAQMKSISAAVGPNLRPTGSGSSSDTDVRLYMSSFPSVRNLGPANTQIAKRLQGESDQKNARSAFYDEWFARRGNLLGAEQEFNKFWSARESQKRQASPAERQRAARQRAGASGGVEILSVEPD